MNEVELIKSLDYRADLSVIKSTDTASGIIKVTGYANTPQVDRSSDLVVWSEESIKNYKSNPILLFAHDRKEPIGKCTLIEIRTGGLYIEAEIDNRWTKAYLIENGTLKTMSVRFFAESYEYLPEKECWLVKASDLLEISIEPIPDNPNATFSVAKSFKSDSDYEAFKNSHQSNNNQDTMKELIKSFEAIIAKMKGAKPEDKPAIEAELKEFNNSLLAFTKTAKKEDESTIAEAIKGFTAQLTEATKTTEEVEEVDEVEEVEETPTESEEVKTLKAELAKTKTALAKANGKPTVTAKAANEDPEQGRDKKTGNEKAAEETAAYFKSIQL